MELSPAEKLDILQKCNAAIKAGKMDEAYTIMEKIPLAPHLAKALKDLIGNDEVKKSRFNLSAAEEVYGKDWLN